MLKRNHSRTTHYAALLTSLTLLAIAGGLNLNCGGAPSSKTVASSRIEEPEMRDPQGGLRFDRNDLKPAQVTLSDTVTLPNGREVPVIRWREAGWQDARATFEDPANPHVATVKAGPRVYYGQTLIFKAEYRHPTSGNISEVEYMLRIVTPYPDGTSEPASK